MINIEKLLVNKAHIWPGRRTFYFSGGNRVFVSVGEIAISLNTGVEVKYCETPQKAIDLAFKFNKERPDEQKFEPVGGYTFLNFENSIR